MNAKVKKVLIIVIGVAVFLFLGILGLNYFIENKIKEQIDKAPENVKIQYENIEVNALQGRVNLIKPLISVYEKTTQKINAKIELEHFSVDGFGFWNYFINDRITIDDILLDQPIITYFKSDKVKSGEDGFKKGLKQLVQIESMEIQDAHVSIYNASNDSLVLKSENLNFKIDAVEFNPSKEKMPVTYRDFKLTSNAIFCSLNDYENFVLKHLELHPGFSKFKGITLKTKYSNEALSNKIKVERDHYDLTIDSVEIKKQDFGFKQDSLFYFKSQSVDFYQPIFKIYRDKLVADDLSHKKLYSNMLRDLKFNLNLNSVFLNNASIVYTEKVKTDKKGGKLLFSKLNGEIKNLGNRYESDDAITSIHIKAIFMDNTPIDTNWEFDVNNPQDEFVFKAEMGKLNAKSLNQFMEPNLNVRLNGEIDKTYFTINGNKLTSHIDLKLRYDDFDVLVLKENGKEKNKFLSSIVNIFVSKDSKDASANFRHGSKSGVERTMNKSVFNYLWLNVKAGLLNAMTGDGKEE